MACYQLMNRLQKAGSWEALRALTGEIRAPYVGVEGAKEVNEFFDTCIPKFSKLAKKGTGEWDVSEIAWMQVRYFFFSLFAPSTRRLRATWVDPVTSDARPIYANNSTASSWSMFSGAGAWSGTFHGPETQLFGLAHDRCASQKVSVVMENMAGGSKVTDALVNFPFHYQYVFTFCSARSPAASG